jgi:hypothetical protein
VARKKGTPKPMGRPVGSINKRSMLVSDVLKKHGIDLVEQILARLNKLDPKDQVAALLQLMPYAHPKLQAIELKIHDVGERPMKEVSDADLDNILEVESE